MKVILREDVEKLGKAGEVVKVADGYGRNFLIPRRLAVPADMRNLKTLEHERKVIENRARKNRRAAESLGARLASLSLTLPAKAGEEGKLFGAVTSRDIALALERAGVPVDRRVVLLPEPIKQVGDYKVKVKAGPDLVPEVSVSVVAEQD
jgi:large subunit ribosomal protein L9